MPAPDDFSREPEKPLFALLDRLGIRTSTISHPMVFTVAESQNVKAHLPGGHTKNLFMKDKAGQLVLVCALGSSVLPLNQLHRALGCQRLSFTHAPPAVGRAGGDPRFGHWLFGPERHCRPGPAGGGRSSPCP
jgi:hypothetical protein